MLKRKWLISHFPFFITYYHFRISQENWHLYPTWLYIFIHEIIGPAIALSAVALKILLKTEMKQFLFGNSVHPVQCGQSKRFQGDTNPLGSLGDNNPKIIITPSED